MLKEIAPGLRRVAVIFSPETPTGSTSYLHSVETAAPLFSFEATGVITLSNVNTDTATPAGSTVGRPGQGAPLRTSLLGTLIGRIDNYQPFAIGNQTLAISMPQTGRLWIGINDGGCADNGGSFRVTIR